MDLIDLFPTVLRDCRCGCARIRARAKTLISWAAAGAVEPLRDCLFSQVGDYHGHLGQSNYGGTKVGRHPGLVQAARTGAYSYIRDPDYGDETYDLTQDPLELNNLLGGDAAEPEPIRELRCRLEGWEQRVLGSFAPD